MAVGDQVAFAIHAGLPSMDRNRFLIQGPKYSPAFVRYRTEIRRVICICLCPESGSLRSYQKGAYAGSACSETLEETKTHHEYWLLSVLLVVLIVVVIVVLV
jgi:hypothetical protein